MKYLIILLLLITGCSSKPINNYDIKLDQTEYQIYVPFKKGIITNYVVNNVLNNYDFFHIEEFALLVSKDYFKPINSLYQKGQYLTEENIKKILEKLNNEKDIIIDEVLTKPNYVSSIIEQNFLSSNGNLKGLTVTLVINPYQPYKNEYGSYNYKKVSEEELSLIIKEKVEILNQQLLKVPEYKKIKKIIPVYVLNSPNSTLPGSVKYISTPNNDKINLNKTNYEYYYLNSEFVNKVDTLSYNNYLQFSETLKETIETLNINGIGLFNNNSLQKINISITNKNYTKDELLYLSNVIAKEINLSFNLEVYVKVILKNNNNICALIIKENNKKESQITLIGG